MIAALRADRPKTFDGLHTWAAAMVIMAVAADARHHWRGGQAAVAGRTCRASRRGWRPSSTARNRPISGVETTAQQIGFFSNLSFASQRELLERMIDDYRRGGLEVEDEGDRDLNAWVSGRCRRRSPSASEAMPPALYEALLPRRNRAWTDWLIARLERPGTVLFAVGAGHLAGPDSVQTMLAGRGFTAARVD